MLLEHNLYLCLTLSSFLKRALTSCLFCHPEMQQFLQLYQRSVLSSGHACKHSSWPVKWPLTFLELMSDVGLPWLPLCPSTRLVKTDSEVNSPSRMSARSKWKRASVVHSGGRWRNSTSGSPFFFFFFPSSGGYDEKNTLIQDLLADESNHSMCKYSADTFS